MLVLISVLSGLLMTANGYYSGQQEYHIGYTGNQYTITVYNYDYVRFNCGMKKIHFNELPRTFNDRDVEISKLSLYDCALPEKSLQDVAEALGAINITNIDMTRVPLITRDNFERVQFPKIKVTNSEVATDAFSGQSRCTVIEVQSSKFTLSEFSFSGAESLRTLKLLDCNINILPQGIFQKTPILLSLNLANNLITEITASDFEGLSSLSELNLKGNRLTSLPNNLFHFMPAAYMFNVNNNPLTEITRDFLEGSRVSYLYISDNTVPLRIPPRALADLHLRYIALLNDNIASLPEDFLAGTTTVEELHLSNNKLEELPAGVFKDKPYLRTLGLSNNRLRVLSPATFAPLSNVRTLNLDNNNLTEIPPATFSSMNQLLELSISNNNLRTVAPDAFPTLLDSLTLNNNQLSTLETTLLPNLYYLLLVGNKFSSVPLTWAATLPNLKQIHLMANSFTELTESDMAALSHYYTTHIYLENNNIVSVHVGQNTTVPSNLGLTGLPLRCDCHMIEFARQLYNYFDTGAICAEPEPLKGTRVTRVPDGDFICQ